MSTDLARRVANHNAGRRPSRVFGQTVVTNDPADPINALLTRTNGEVLACPTSTNRGEGEWDHYRDHIGTRDLRRLIAAGLIKRGGLEPDRLADVYGWDGDASSFVEHYAATCLAGLDHRAELRDGKDWASLEPPDDCEDDAERTWRTPTDTPATPAPVTLPEPLVAYLNRLICERKRQYAAEVTLALHERRPIPACGAPWGPDVVHKITRYYRKGS